MAKSSYHPAAMEKLAKKSLKALLREWAAVVAGTDQPQPPRYTGPDVLLTGFVEHTAQVEPGRCFVARVRTGTDGHPYIGAAIARGAALILGQRDPAELDIEMGTTPYLQADDTAVAEAWLAAAWYGFPSLDLVVIGVTGTDGKTTTVNLLHSILRAAGLGAGMLSTIKASVGDSEEPLALHVTTPEAPVVQAYLRRMVDAGLTHCILETTSHGLAQERVSAVDFDIAVVTNITHEHLDYHGDYNGYFAAKAKLFKGLVSGGLGLIQSRKRNSAKAGLTKMAILNRDDSSYEPLADIVKTCHLSYAIDRPADFNAVAILHTAAGIHFDLNLPDANRPTPGSPVSITSPLFGAFNIYNMLAAAAAAFVIGIDPNDIRQGLQGVGAMRGRMEPVSRGQAFLVLVDFAHTPNALAQAIKAAQKLTSGRVITVFGSAGKRDKAKRQLMAEISARQADLTVLTAEDPRTESLADILAMMAEGCRQANGIEGSTFWLLPDRGQAIYFALSLANPDDVVLICGKGHEQSICFGVVEHPWDDVQATITALDALAAGMPMPDLGLPTYEPGSETVDDRSPRSAFTNR